MLKKAASFVLLWSMGSLSPAQVVGPEAEMERLEQRAEEAIANEDPEGAAMSIGKAALMASELAKREQDSSRLTLLQAAERLFRGQEHAYRAVAMFERAGGQPPASSGVCGTLALAESQVTKSGHLLAADRPSTPAPTSAQERDRLKALAADWALTIDELRTDFQCR